MHNVIIMGSGCAGLTAAIYTARASLKPLVLDGHEPGGQLSLTTHVENFPGFPDGIMGPELIENMRKQAARFGADFKAGNVTEVDLTRRPFRVKAANETYETRALIVAAGASARLLGLPGEKELIGRETKPVFVMELFSRLYAEQYLVSLMVRLLQIVAIIGRHDFDVEFLCKFQESPVCL